MYVNTLIKVWISFSSAGPVWVWDWVSVSWEEEEVR